MAEAIRLEQGKPQHIAIGTCELVVDEREAERRRAQDEKPRAKPWLRGTYVCHRPAVWWSGKLMLCGGHRDDALRGSAARS